MSSGLRFIVADDEGPARFVLASLLADLGYPPESIVEAASGSALIEAARERAPDCAFVDVRMPGMDGLAAIEAAAPLCPLAKWVVVSSHAEFEYARLALRLGVTEYLLKPVRPEELASCLERLGLGPASPSEDRLLGPVLEYLGRNFNADASVAAAAELAGVTPNYLSALFHKRMGCTIVDHLARLRVEEAARLLRSGLSVAEAGQAVGYSDPRHFARKFKSVMGSLPSEYSARK